MKLIYYKTVEKKSECLIKEKGSKFIGFCEPCLNAESAKEILKSWHIKHPQATHICYAFRFGLNKITYKTNDDGEPTNSAGIPILGQIQSFELTNVIIGVVRYYGGTKLGVGGLVSAYKTASKKAIEENLIVEKELSSIIEITFDYFEMPMILNKIKQQKVEIIQQEIQQECRLKVIVYNSKLDEFKNEIIKFKTIIIENEINEI